MNTKNELESFNRFSVKRHGPVLSARGAAFEETAVMNPSTFKDRSGKLLMVYRSMYQGISSIHLASWEVEGFKRHGPVLKPEFFYEQNGRDGVSGCEDPRVTFVKDLDEYVMAYTVNGPSGPRIAVAVSKDGWCWARLGRFEYPERLDLSRQDDKNGCFFPNGVLSPSGRLSIACLHRPKIPMNPNGLDDVNNLLAREPDDRPGIWIAYWPIDKVKADISSLLKVEETMQVLTPDMVPWSTQLQMQLGAGTPFLPTSSGFLSLFHGVIAYVDRGILETGRYDLHHWGGFFLLDSKRPHKVRFVGNRAALQPETDEELGNGRYTNVAFPTAIERVDNRTVDIYYGAADQFICKATIVFEEPLLK